MVKLMAILITLILAFSAGSFVGQQNAFPRNPVKYCQLICNASIVTIVRYNRMNDTFECGCDDR